MRILSLGTLSAIAFGVYGSIALAQQPAAGPFEFSGYVDVYYQSSPQAHDPTAPATGPAYLEGRVFDTHHNQFTLNMVELSAKRKVGDVTLRVDLGFGHMVDALAGNGTLSNGQPAATNSEEPTRNITQAFVTYSPSKVPNLSFTAGKFATHMGYEVTRAKDNWQYSRSLTFNYGIPFWHEGLSVNYGFIPGTLVATVYLLNAWDGRISTEMNKSPTAGLNINTTPIEGLSVNYNYIGGLETADGRREAHEINFSYAIIKEMSLAADYVLGTQEKAFAAEDAKWSGIAVYLKYSPVDWYSLSPRYEVFDDSDKGYILGTSAATPATKHKIASLTVSNNFLIGDGLEARLEYRTDRSDADGYFKDRKGAATKLQNSYAVALLYSF